MTTNLTPGLPGQEGITEREEYVVEWFPPDAPKREKVYDDADPEEAERKARRYAKRKEVAAWNPLIVHRVIVTMTVEEILPL